MPVPFDDHISMACLLEGWPLARRVVTRRGMACVGCPMARFETVAEAAHACGFDPGDLLREVASGRPPRRSATAAAGRRPR